ncbi:efflux RND transporter periplasmic adaptor subunit [Methylosinus sp. LW4]|uniref:efflux RND transporter periplasmic adaptor subunit n=1 Tax=Methylosinus sp. LW4 TaxID=136993 RepID=UPI00037EE5E8|nr:efflux RND transporter periplasmic adaptor subunit [Methylosinus sp. LW4]
MSYRSLLLRTAAHRKVVLASVALTFIVALFGRYAATPSHSAAGVKQAPVVPVSVDKVSRADVQSFLTAPGTVKPLNSATIRSRVDGLLKKVLFVEGQLVHAGDLLAEVDPDPYEAAVDLAEAAKARDEAQLVNARRDLGRYSRLTESGAISAQQKDATKSLVAQYEAAVKADQAQIELAQIQFQYCKIVAPFDGRVGTKIVDPGNVVRAGEATGIVTINQIKPIAIEFTVPADALPQLREALGRGVVPVIAEDTAGKLLARGELVMIDNQINPTSATIRLKANFENADESLWPGLFVNVRLPLSTYKSALTTAAGAIQLGAAGHFAYVVGTDNIVEKRAIAVGYSDRSLAVVTTGLNEHETVVTEGHYRIQSGSRVQFLVTKPEAGG